MAFNNSEAGPATRPRSANVFSHQPLPERRQTFSFRRRNALDATSQMERLLLRSEGQGEPRKPTRHRRPSRGSATIMEGINDVRQTARRLSSTCRAALHIPAVSPTRTRSASSSFLSHCRPGPSSAAADSSRDLPGCISVREDDSVPWWHRALRERMASGRMFDPPAYMMSNQMDTRPDPSPSLNTPGDASQPPVVDPTGGFGARAFAATFRQYQKMGKLSREDTPSGSASLSDLTSDDESGVFIGEMEDVDMEDADVDSDRDSMDIDMEKDNTKIKAFDPITVCPPEIRDMILSYLDLPSLSRMEQVSKAWSAAAKEQYVWRKVFQQKYSLEPGLHRPPVLMGGVGIGRFRHNQDWKKMYQARRKIEMNWYQGNGKAVYMSGHTDSVYCLQFDEEKIITGSRDRTIRVWDLHTYKCLKVIGGPQHRPQPETRPPLITHPEHTISAELSVNGTPEGNAIFHAPTDFHDASILCLQFDKEICVTGSSDQDCIVWDLATWQPIRRLKRHTQGVLDICFDDKYIVSCSKDATICVWSRKDFSLVRQLQGHRGPVNAVQLRGNYLVSASGDGVARLWDLTKLTTENESPFVREFTSRDRGLAAVEFSEDARYVLAGGNDQVIYRFDAQTSQLVQTYTGHANLVRSLYLDGQNNRVISGSYDMSLRVYDYQNARLLCSFPTWTTSWMLAAKSDYRRIVSTSQDGRVLLVDFGHEVPGAEMLRDI